MFAFADFTDAERFSLMESRAIATDAQGREVLVGLRSTRRSLSWSVGGGG